jgi:hypothetical protein
MQRRDNPDNAPTRRISRKRALVALGEIDENRQQWAELLSRPP